MNAIIPLTGYLVEGPADGNLVTCEARRIPTMTRTYLVLDNSTKIQVTEGSYIWNDEAKAFIWNLESVAFPARPTE
jgi:hypothetical protein